MIFDNLTYEQCVVQGIGPLVFPARLEQGIDPTHSAQMKAVCVQNIQQQIKIGHTLRLAWDALTRAGIQPVLMKGAGLAALYPSPEQRPFGDIDLFVGMQNYHPACAVMRQTFPKALKFDEELDHYKHYNLIADGISIEIHRVTVDLQHPLDKRRYAKMEYLGTVNGEGLEVNGLKLTVFEPTFNALFVMLHAWEHMMTQGANVRQLCDLAMLLQHDQSKMKIPQLAHDLKALHLMDVWQLFAYLLVHYIDLPKEEVPFYTDQVAERAERLRNDLLAGRLTTPHYTTAPTRRLARKWHTMQQRLAEGRRIAQYSPAYARHMQVTTMLHGALRLFAKDRKWE